MSAASCAGLKVARFPDELSWLRAGLAEVRAAMDRAADRGQTDCHICLAGGNTPAPLYEAIAVDPAVRARASGTRPRMQGIMLHFWIGDERAVPADSPLRNAVMIARTLGGAPGVLHRWPDLPPAQACAGYAEELAASGRVPAFGLALLGMGADGHIASLFPGDAAALESTDIAVPARAPAEPRDRMTLGFRVFNAAERIRILVRGRDKAAMIERVSAGDPSLPICRLASPDAVLLYLES